MQLRHVSSARVLVSTLACVMRSAFRAGGIGRVPVAVAFCAVGLSAPGAVAQDEVDRPNEERLEDFVHFVTIGNVVVAEDLAGEIVDSGITPTEFVDLVEGGRDLDRFRRAIELASRNATLRDVAGRLESLYRQGRLERARNDDEIARNIEQLMSPSTRARAIARERLVEAGEYAMPRLLEAMLDRSNPTLRVRARAVVLELGRQAVVPLSVAMLKLDPERQEFVADVLGELQYRHSLPYLADVLRDAESPTVRSTLQRAIERLGGDAGTPAGVYYAGLSEGYYDERDELTSFPGEEFQLLWTYDPGNGLLPTGIRTPVYHEAMAMRLAERALTLDPTRSEAVELWIASNFSREIDSPEGYRSPAYGPARREARYFAVAAGPVIGQSVLGRALGDQDVPLARRAISVIEEVAGSESLVGGGSTSSLLEAISFPNRRVRFDAALALARSQPSTAFEGAERVVPILAGAVRTASERYAVVLTGDDREEYGRLRAILNDAGFEVMPPAPGGYADIAQAIAETPGIDVVVTSTLMPTRVREAISGAARRSRLATAPVVSLVSAADVPDLTREYGRDLMVLIRRATITESQLTEAIRQAVERAGGEPLDAAEAARYEARALAALRDLAVSRSRVLPVRDAVPALVAALTETGGETQRGVAEVLALIPGPDAQVPLAEASLDAAGSQQIALLGELARSAKRFGNLLEPRQVRRLIELADADRDDLATAAAAVIGALDLDEAEVVPLILSDRGRDAGGVAQR